LPFSGSSGQQHVRHAGPVRDVAVVPRALAGESVHLRDVNPLRTATGGHGVDPGDVAIATGAGGAWLEDHDGAFRGCVHDGVAGGAGGVDPVPGVAAHRGIGTGGVEPLLSGAPGALAGGPGIDRLGEADGADRELVDGWHGARKGTGLPGDSRIIGQIPICWDTDEAAAVARAHDQFRWFAGGWSVNADLPTTAGFAGATQFVREEDVASSIPCGPDLDAIVDAVSKYWEAGFTDIALVQVGDEGQDRFLEQAAAPLLEKLRNAAG